MICKPDRWSSQPGRPSGAARTRRRPRPLTCLARVFVAALAVVFVQPIPAQAQEISEQQGFTVGDWTGYANFDEDGLYLSCAVQQWRPSGAQLFLRLTEGGLMIVLINPSWNLPVGDRHAATVIVDDRWVERTIAVITTANGSVIDLGHDAEAVDALRRGRSLTVQMPERTFQFSLNDSSAAIARLRECHERNTRSVAIAEAPPAPASPASANPFAPADTPPSAPAAPPSSNPFAPAGATPLAPESAAPGNPFAPAAPQGGAGSPSEIAAAPARTPGGPRPEPDRDGVQRITPYLPFEAFALTVELLLPGEPEVWETPDDRLADYQFRGETDQGLYRGLYLEVAPLGETVEETLYRFMWVSEMACDGRSRVMGSGLERFGGTGVAWETIECGTSGGPLFSSAVVSHTAESAQIFVVDGETPVHDVTKELYRLLRGLAQDG